MGREEEVLFAMEQEVKCLVADIHASLAARRVNEPQLLSQAQQLLELCQEDAVLDLVVLVGGLDVVAPLLALTHNTHGSHASVARVGCAILSAMAGRQEFKRLLAAQALPGLLRLLGPDVRGSAHSSSAADALASLVQDSRAIQDMVWQAGGVDCLLQLLGRGGGQSAAAGQHAAVLGALSALVCRNDACKRAVVEEGGLHLLIDVLQMADAHVQHRALQLLTDLVHGNKALRQKALQAGVLLPLVRLLSVGDSQTQRAVALLVGQFAAPPLQEGALTVGRGASLNVEAQLIPALIPLLTAGSHAVQETAAFALARLAQLPSYRHATVKV